ncbi:MAG: pilus assembly PilX N-terminal domain-containing protein [Desulfobacteraceae bacterium]|jgi:Tfp pilus assembly protein PilX
MKFKSALPRWDHQGYVLAVTMYVLLLLTVIGIAAIQTSTIEMQIAGNTKKMTADFYATEGALITVLERTDWWLSDAFLNSETAAANWVGKVDSNEDATDDAMVEIRCIEKSKSAISALSEAANNIPADRHSTPPPINSGYSARHFRTRKYAVTATSLKSNTKLQTGVWKVFNKQ